MSWIQQHRIFRLIVVLLVPTLAAAMMVVPDEDEKEISVQDLPDSVQKALKDFDVDEVEVTSFGYEIEVAEDDVEVELRLDKDGRLLGLEIEEDNGEDSDDGEDNEEDEDEENAKAVELSAIPAAARDAINKFAAGNAVESVEQEEKDGHTLFEALWKMEGVEHEATVTTQGVLVELEEVTTADALPADVRKQSNRHFRNAKDMKFERKLIAAYEIEGIVNGKARERLVTPTGAEIEFEHDDEHNGEHHDDDDDDDDDEDEDDE